MPELKKNVITPEGLLIWSHVFAPDDDSKFADGKYKVSQRFFGEAATKIMKDLDDLAEKACKELGTEQLDSKLYRVPTDKDKKEIVGAIEVKFKTQSRPVIIDGKKNRLTQAQVPGYAANCQLGTGHVVFSTQAMEVSGKYYMPLYLQAVQITALSSGAVDMNMFDEVDDGFVADVAVAVETDVGGEDEIPSFAA